MRGKFVVFEGLDRSGKSTLSRLLKEQLSQDSTAELIAFPNRQTEIGKTINRYLTSQMNMSNEAIHLLFSANRWESMADIQAKLAAGIHVICDRYYYSGVAYSYAKGLELDWCRKSDKGILEPDMVIYLKCQPQILSKRAGFGQERFEKLDFQKKVAQAYEKILTDENVYLVEVAEKTIKQLTQQLSDLVRSKLQK